MPDFGAHNWILQISSTNKSGLALCWPKDRSFIKNLIAPVLFKRRKVMILLLFGHPEELFNRWPEKNRQRLCKFEPVKGWSEVFSAKRSLQKSFEATRPGIFLCFGWDSVKFGRGLVLSKKKKHSVNVSTFVGRKLGSPTFVEKEQLSSTVHPGHLRGPGHSFSMAASRFSRDVWLRSCIGTLRVRVCPLSRGGCLPHGRALAELVWVFPVSGRGKDGDFDFNRQFLVQDIHDFFGFSGDVGVGPPKLWRSHRYPPEKGMLNIGELQRHAIFRLFFCVCFLSKAWWISPENNVIAILGSPFPSWLKAGKRSLSWVGSTHHPIRVAYSDSIL